VSSSIYDAPAGAEMVTGATVTPGLLAMLGVAPAKGGCWATAMAGAAPTIAW
jgi:hypothetical protein